MEFKDVVYGRRSVRSFSDKAIEDETLKEIIDAGLWAPSGVNLQPWYFVAVKSPKAMERLKKIMADIAEKNRAHLEERFADHPEVVKNTVSFIAKLGNAPVVLLAFRDKPDYSWALQDEGIVQSVAAAMENILLSAYDHGVASCWLTAPTQAAMGEVLRDEFAPGHGNLICIAAMGYPVEGKEAKPPKRKENKFAIV